MNLRQNFGEARLAYEQALLDEMNNALEEVCYDFFRNLTRAEKFSGG